MKTEDNPDQLMAGKKRTECAECAGSGMVRLTGFNSRWEPCPRCSRERNSWLQQVVGRSLPSRKYGAWIVAEVSGNIEGRSRLVTGNLKGEQWVWTRSLVAMLAKLDAPNGRGERPGPNDA